MRTAFIIAMMLLLAACGGEQQPNQELAAAYQLLRSGELNAAKLLAEKAERKTDADQALYNIVRGAVAAATLERPEFDSLAIEQSIYFFKSDDEKLAWAHLVMGEMFYILGYDDEAAIEFRTAELLSEGTDCNELKFCVYNKLASFNINSYNWENYDDFAEKNMGYQIDDQPLVSDITELDDIDFAMF